MVFSLKKAAKGVFGIGGEEMDRIQELPMTQLRLELKAHWQEKKFDAQQYDAFVEKLSKVDDLKGQVAIAKAATEKGEVESEIDIELNSPAKQLLWAAALTRLMDAAEEHPVAQTGLWKQIQGTIGVNNEAIMVSKMLSQSIQNDDVTYGWGQPGSWFYQDPLKNHLNFDLYFMLLCGFEYIRSVEGHEVGHSQLSTAYPPRMQELYEKVKQFIDPRTVENEGTAPPQMTKKQQVELAGEVAEWQYWHRSWNHMEDLTVDQFSIDLSRVMPQDYGDALNHAAILLRGYGEVLRGDDLKKPVQITTNLPDPNAPKKDILDQIREAMEEHARQEQQKKIEELQKIMTSPLTPQDIKDIKAGKISLEIAQKMYEETNRATLLSGYIKNGLFSDKDENWERFRIFKDDINSTVDMTKVPDANGRDAFQYLFDLCVEGPDSIRLLQPQPQDRMLERNGKSVNESYKEVVAETTKARGEVMQKIWDIYIKPYADVMIQEYKNQTKKNLDQQQNQKGQNDQGQKGQGQPGQGQPGQGQPGQGQPGQSGGGGSSGMDSQQPQSGGNSSSPSSGGQQKPGGEKPGGGGGEDEDDTPQDMDKDLKDQVGNMAETPQEKEAKEQAKDKQNGQGNDKSDDQKPGQDGQGEGQDGKPEQKKGKDKDGKGGPGWGQDPSQQQQPIKVGDMKDKNVMKEDMSAEEKAEMKERAKSMPKVAPDSMQSKAGNQRGVDLARLAKGDYKDFNRRCIELAPVINQVAESYKRIKEEQRRQILQAAKTLDYLPPDGDIQERLDRDRVLEAKFKKVTKQKMSLDDAKKFRDDHIATTEATIEMFAMIDGSGSMPGLDLGNGVSAMDVAMQSAVINYMACRKVGIPGYIVMWGDSEPIVIATPDTPLKQVGEEVERLRRGTNSGTSLAPGLQKGVETIANYRSKPGTISGSTHMLVYSDGDIGDPDDTIKMLEFIGKDSKNLSVDVAILRPGEGTGTQMEKAFQKAIDKTGGKLVGIVHGNNANEVPLELSRLMLRRVRSFKVKAEADSEKRRRLKALHRRMTGD
jgi:hypothetical protein